MEDFLATASTISPVNLANWIIQRGNIWQMDFVNTHGLASFATERGLPSLYDEEVEIYWKSGLLRADLIKSDTEYELEGLVLIHQDKTSSYYADNRDFQFPNGIGNIAADLPELPEGLQLQFHPFRFVVLYHMRRILKPWIAPRQELTNRDGYKVVLSHWQQTLDKWSRSQEFALLVDEWNKIARLAIAVEPCQYITIFGRQKRPAYINDEIFQGMIEAHFACLSFYWQSEGLDTLEKMRDSLCTHAELLDPNKAIHTILRLANGERRLNSRGELGGAMILLTMAEMLRRMSEHIFNTKLPEEDEKGFGVVFRSAKEKIYGSVRLLDGDESVANAYLRNQGLDYNVRVRWYVEGDTEYHAVARLLGHDTQVDIVNLGGFVSQNRGKGLAFRDSLRNDIRTQIFSLVSIDGDRKDNARAVRKAAEEDEICGMFFIALPDFEFGNFSPAELEDILWQYAEERRVEIEKREVLHGILRNSRSAKELFNQVRQLLPDLADINKGEEWGRRLADYAWQHREADIQNQDTDRPFIRAIYAAMRSRSANYISTRNDYRVDPQTGQPIKRAT